MAETLERPFTAEERSVLGRAPGFPPSWFAGVAGAVGVGIILSLVLLLALSLFENGAEMAPRGALAAGALSAVLYWGRRQRQDRNAWAAERLRRAGALAGGVARITRYQARDAIAIDEFEDEGIGYFLELADGRVLYLGGQYLYHVAEARRFPATEFEISQVAATGDFLGLTPRGSYLAPSSTRPPFTAEEYEAGVVPEDRAMVDRAFEDLRRVAV
jgi:hypothetical protein